MTHLLLIRHGETDWNSEGRWQGHADIPLNLSGVQQAEQIAKTLESVEVDAIYASDLLRARETAEVLARDFNLPVSIDKRLREVDQGQWQGLRVSEIQERFGQEFQRRQAFPYEVAPPGGETTRQVQDRALQAIQAIRANHSGQTVLVVSHAFVIAVILAHYKQLPIQQVWDLVPKNCEVTHLDV